MAIHRGIITLSLLLSMLLAGCDENDDSGGGSASPAHLRLLFINNYLKNAEYAWVVVHSLTGTQILSVYKVLGDTTLDLGNVGTRTTFTLAIQYGDTSFYYDWVRSFYDVPSRDWVFDGYSPYSEEPLGWADFTITFPAGYYTECSISPTGTGMGWWEEEIHSPLHCLTEMNLLESGELSAFGSVVADTFAYYGRLVSQPFQQGDTNYYTLALDQPATRRTITASQPIDWVRIGACRNIWDYSYFVASDENFDDDNATEIWAGDFPCSRWILSLLVLHEPTVWATVYSSTFPTHVDIPDVSLSASLNPSDRIVENVVMNGSADLVWCWYLYFDRNYYWAVAVEPTSTSIHRPVLPDSIYVDLGIDSLDQPFVDMVAYDASPIQGFDQILSRIFAHKESFWFDKMFEYQADVTQSAVLTSPSSVPDEKRLQRSLPLQLKGGMDAGPASSR